MKMWTGAAVVAAVGLAVGLAFAQPERKPGTPAKPQPEKQPGGAETAEMMAAKPGPEHARLAKLAGEFTTVAKFDAIGAPPEMPKGEATAKMTLGGRFLEITEKGTMMGEPFEAVQIWGYNNGSKKYESVWRYTMATGFMTMKGQSKDGGKTIECDASFEDHEGKTESMKVGFKIESDDAFVITLTASSPGNPDVTMTTNYTRKK